MDPAVRNRKQSRPVRVGLAVALLAGVLAPLAAILAAAAPAGAQTPATTYSAAAPTLDSITSPAVMHDPEHQHLRALERVAG